MRWYCRSCGYNGDIEVFVSKNMAEALGDKDHPDARRYVCKYCGIRGPMTDGDAPIQITDAQHDEYWEELQTDKFFIPPEELTDEEHKALLLRSLHAVNDEEEEPDDENICGLCGMRYVTPPHTACSTCA